MEERGRDGCELNVPQKDKIMRSDGYDGKLTFTSSDEDVVKVDAETGAITIVGPGKATITVSGAATDYRNAPASITYQIVIVLPGDANGDGNVNVADVDYVIERIGEEKTDANKAADVNGDGEINVADVDYVIERIV